MCTCIQEKSMLVVSNWKHILKHKKHKIAKYSKQHFTATISDQEMYAKKTIEHMEK